MFDKWADKPEQNEYCDTKNKKDIAPI